MRDVQSGEAVIDKQIMIKYICLHSKYSGSVLLFWCSLRIQKCPRFQSKLLDLCNSCSNIWVEACNRQVAVSVSSRIQCFQTLLMCTLISNSQVCTYLVLLIAIVQSFWSPMWDRQYSVSLKGEYKSTQVHIAAILLHRDVASRNSKLKCAAAVCSFENVAPDDSQEDIMSNL